MLVVSFYTKNTPYKEESEKLIVSLEKFDIPYRIYERESTGDHVKNSHMKPGVILGAMCEYPGINIVWMDADAVLLNGPSEIRRLDMGELNHDLAAVTIWGRESRNKLVHLHWKIVMGCVFFRNTAKMRNICREWQDACEGSKWSDHGHLMNVLYEHRNEINYYELPFQYIKKVPLKADDQFFQVVKHDSGYRRVKQGQWQI